MTLGDINNPLATGYAVYASIQRDTVMWSLKKLENVDHSFLYESHF